MATGIIIATDKPRDLKGAAATGAPFLMRCFNLAYRHCEERSDEAIQYRQ
jgi:hypothetical protein